MNKGEVIVILGFPASGKTTLSKPYEELGYVRLNRDSLGGTLKGLSKKFSEILNQGNSKNFVLDNTYATKQSRAEIISIAKQNGLAVKCVWLQTSIEDAQYNSSLRMYANYGCLLSPDEIKKSKDPNTFPPMVQYKYRKDFEPPSLDEGFDEVIAKQFERKQERLYTNKGLLLDYDGTLRETISGAIFPVSPDDIRVRPGVKEKLDEAIAEGYTLVGVSNQSGVHKGSLTSEAVQACFDRTNELLGIDIPVLWCPHQSNPISCYCRKPMPGHGVVAIEKYKLDASKTIMVGDMTTDETFAKRCGLTFIHTDKFFLGE